MNENDYINQIDKIIDIINNKKSKIILIAPWISTDDDPISKLNHKDKKEMMKKYSLALAKYSKINNYNFIDPNEYLEASILKNKKKYLIDYIHPNSKEGIKLYCGSILKNEK